MNNNHIMNQERKKLYPALKDLHNIIKKEQIPLFGLSVIDLEFHNRLSYENPIYIITDKDNAFFIDIFKKLYKKYNRTRNQVFFSLPTKKRYHYIYMLNLQPVLIIHFNKDPYPFYIKNSFKCTDILISLSHMYYEYTLPYNFSKFWLKWIKVESDGIENLLKLNYEQPKFKPINFNFEPILEKIKNRDDLIITGGYAYDLLMNTNYFKNSKLQLITVNSTELIKELFNDFKTIEISYNDKIQYFYNHYQLFDNDVLICEMFSYNRLVNYVKINEYKLSNPHGIIFHLMLDKGNQYYIIKLLNYIKNNFNVFQKNYLLDFAEKILCNRVTSYYK